VHVLLHVVCAVLMMQDSSLRQEVAAEEVVNGSQTIFLKEDGKVVRYRKLKQRAR